MKKAFVWGKIRRQLEQRQGTTMIEVLVAVVVVLLITVMFSRVVTVSVRMFRSSVNMMDETEEFNREYYKTANYGSRPQSADHLVLTVDMAKTQDATASGASLALNNNSRSVYWKEASGYDMYAVSIGGYGETVPDGGPGGSVPTPEPKPEPTREPNSMLTPEPDPTPDGSPGLTVDVDGTRQPIQEYNNWETTMEQVKQQYLDSITPGYEGWKTYWHTVGAGEVYMMKDESGEYVAYVCQWGNDSFEFHADDTIEDFIRRYADSKFVKITKDTRVFTSKDIRQYYENNGNVQTFNPEDLPKKGELYWDGVEYHLARQDIGPYDTDFTTAHWLTIEQPAEPPAGEEPPA